MSVFVADFNKRKCSLTSWNWNDRQRKLDQLELWNTLTEKKKVQYFLYATPETCLSAVKTLINFITVFWRHIPNMGRWQTHLYTSFFSLYLFINSFAWDFVGAQKLNKHAHNDNWSVFEPVSEMVLFFFRWPFRRCYEGPLQCQPIQI